MKAPINNERGRSTAFGEHTAQHREADALPASLEPRQETLPRLGAHAPVLAPLGDVGALQRQAVSGLFEVVEAAEESQVVAGMGVELPGDDVHQGLQRPPAVGKARGDAPRDLHRQLLGREGRRHVDPGRVRRQAQQLDGVVGR